MSLDLSTFRLNSPLGKRILATVREGNYAHPGEEEAIELALQPYARGPKAKWLDAGCGRGGTAAFIQQRGWATVSAFDIDAVSIAEAQVRYPEVTFRECGVAEAAEAVPGTFDLIYSFNAFYAFPEQPRALEALRRLAAPNGKLVIFEYVDRGGFFETSMVKLPEGQHWQPIDEARFPELLQAAGWKLESAQNLDADYRRWYTWLVSRFDSRREALEQIASPETIDYAKNFYVLLLEAVLQGHLGGGIFAASAA